MQRSESDRNLSKVISRSKAARLTFESAFKSIRNHRSGRSGVDVATITTTTNNSIVNMNKSGGTSSEKKAITNEEGVTTDKRSGTTAISGGDGGGGGGIDGSSGGKTKKLVKKSKTVNLVKKFTNLKNKHKVSPKKDTPIASTTTTVHTDTEEFSGNTTPIRHTPEGGNLSLTDLTNVELSSLKTTPTTRPDSKVSIIPTVTVQPPHQQQQQQTDPITQIQSNITESIIDRTPIIQAPSIPNDVIIITATAASAAAVGVNNSSSEKGAIRKQLDSVKLRKQQSRDEFFGELIKSDLTTGNSLSNQNLSCFKSFENIHEKSNSDHHSEEEGTINFTIGSSVRPLNTIINKNPLPSELQPSKTVEDEEEEEEPISITSSSQRRRITLTEKESNEYLSSAASTLMDSTDWYSTQTKLTDNNGEIISKIMTLIPAPIPLPQPHGDLIIEEMLITPTEGTAETTIVVRIEKFEVVEMPPPSHNHKYRE